MTIHTEEQLDGLRRAGRTVADVLRRMAAAIEPGMRTDELDALGERWLAEAGAEPAPRLSYGFPGATCISVNEEIAHGIPGARRLARGDLVNIDVSARLDGFFADTGASVVVPPAGAAQRRVCRAARHALDAALAEVRAGAPLNRIGRAIEGVARVSGLRVVRNLCSHGVGGALHEAPTEITGYHEPRDRRLMAEGQVFTIEPFLSTKARAAVETADGWTLVGPAGALSAQYEHTLVVGRHGPIVVTDLAWLH